MRIFTTAIIALFISAAFMACKKDSESSPAPAAGIEGLYNGKYGFGNETPGSNYTLNLKPGGIIEEIGQSSGSPTGRGTWKLEGNKLTAAYTMLFEPYSDYFIEANFNSSGKSITGTWGYENATDGGKFTVTRK